MLDFFAQIVSSLYLPNKVRSSLPLAKTMPRKPLPVLGQAKANGYPTKDLAEAINAQCHQLKYRSDPGNGLVDLYNHPEHTQYLLETGAYETSACDCDDFATYAIALFLKAGVARDKVWEWNMIVPWHKQFTQARWNHVICGFTYWDGSQEWTGIIETNTAARNKLFWFKGTATEAKSAVLKTFCSVYTQADYYEAVLGQWNDKIKNI